MNYIYVVIIVFAFLVHQFGKDYYTQRLQKNKCNPKVFDLGHKYLPDLSDNQILPILLNIVPFIPLIVGVTFTQEYVSFFIVILLIRVVFNIVTILPKHKTCDDSYNWSNVIFGHCYDKIFSGHMASSTLLSLLLYKNNIFTNIPVHITLNILNGLLLLILRWHYTIDLFVAIVVTLLVYQNNIQIVF